MTDKILFYSLVAIILATLYYTNASMFNSQSQFTIKAVKYKAFDESCLINGTFNTGNIADCLKHCLENCRCQSFQICPNTKCQLCSSHKEENSSLLHDKDGCVYATYGMGHLTKISQKLEGQCSGMSCSMKYNCCQQSGLCPKNKTCKPINTPKQPWKRFSCECPDGYHGYNCEQPIHSCGGYLDRRRRKNGMHKVLDFQMSLYEVYCHFDSDGAWTLVQSFSFANHTVGNGDFPKRLSDDNPVSENTLTWSGYRVSNTRMLSINQNSDQLLFTCGFEKVHYVNQTDYLQMSLEEVKLNKYITTEDYENDISSYRGQINGTDLHGCKIKLHQNGGEGFHVHIKKKNDCTFEPAKPTAGGCGSFKYFSYFENEECLLATHRCTQNRKSTSQLWFGQKP